MDLRQTVSKQDVILKYLLQEPTEIEKSLLAHLCVSGRTL